MAKLFLTLGGINAALVVLFGAFGAHGLKARLPEAMLVVYQTGVQYHLFHALGLLAVGLVALRLPDSACLRWSGGLMQVGIILFSGSLYVLSMSGLGWFGMITPVGGIAFIAAWVLFVMAVAKID
jgi:uncharacterized membrane protein YgdD (TMEM256/DUF423 family)